MTLLLGLTKICSLFLLFLATLTSPEGTPILPFYRSITAASYSVFVESKLRPLPVVSSLPPPPSLAYLVSGSKGDGAAVTRVLLALYHPNNRYVVHLDLESSPEERSDLVRFVEGHALFKRFGNVRVIKKANLVTYRGPTMVANTLHAATILLRELGDWDWFINLSASDYPLVTQDGTRLFQLNQLSHSRIRVLNLLHTFSYLPRDLNFIDHTSDIGWKDHQRARPIIVDPGLYMNKKQDVFWICRGGVGQRLSSFSQGKEIKFVSRFYFWFYVVQWEGSAWMTLSKSFIDYCIWGWDNLPRTVLMYYPKDWEDVLICIEVSQVTDTGSSKRFDLQIRMKSLSEKVDALSQNLVRETSVLNNKEDTLRSEEANKANLVKNIEELKHSVKEKSSAVKKAEEGATDLKKKVDELTKSLEEHDKEYQISFDVII
ncbi:Beta-glucuronosyltransferase GlcAT14B [Glycine max]|nr:Beta-glucuronosyltransferase GlcAT14B [Glycine max]